VAGLRCLPRAMVGILLVSSLLVPLTVVVVSTAIRNRVPVSQLLIEPVRLELGEGKPGEQVDGKFSIRNPTRDDAPYTLRASCGCTSLTPHEGVLRAGDAQAVHISVVLPDHVDSERRVAIVLDSNGQPLARCIATAKCPAPFRVTPKRIEFGRLKPSDCRERSVRISPREGRVPIDLDRLLIQASPESLVVTKRHNPDSSVQLAVRVPKEVAGPRFTGSVRIGLEDDPAHPVSVPVFAEFITPLSIAPRTATLCPAPATGEFLPVTLICRSSDPTLKIDSISIKDEPAGVRIERTKRLDRWRTLVEIVVLDANAWVNDKMVVQFACPGTSETVSVTLSMPPGQHVTHKE
jgi:HYDIN/CFA65/VesB-like, Ig-like domain